MTFHRALQLLSVVVLLLLHLQDGVVNGDEEFPALIVLGDSTMDVGINNYLLTVVKSNFKPYGRDFPGGQPTGRFSNGLIICDYIALKLGIPFPLPYLAPEAEGEALLTGVNFASSASGYYEGTAVNFNVAGLTKQLQWFQEYQAKLVNLVGAEQTDHIIKNAAYIVSTGSNDFVNNYYLNLPLQKQYPKPEYTKMLGAMATQFFENLYSLGARRIVLISVPPLGCLPSQISLYNGGTECVASLNDDSRAINALLEASVSNLKQTLPGLKMVYLDAYTTLEGAFYDPSAYGTSHARKACCGTGLLEVSILCNEASPDTCDNANEYLFWDSFHPSQTVYEKLANKYYYIARPQLL